MRGTPNVRSGSRKAHRRRYPESPQMMEERLRFVTRLLDGEGIGGVGRKS
jgi:hypothetical protein